MIYTITTIPKWHQEMFQALLEADFKGNKEVIEQIESADFNIIDNNQSLEIFPKNLIKANIEKTVPVEVWGMDSDNMEIQVLLFVSLVDKKGYMLQILRVDGEDVKNLPDVDKFEIIVLGK